MRGPCTENMTTSTGTPMSHCVLWQHILRFVQNFPFEDCCETQSRHWPIFTYVRRAERVRLELSQSWRCCLTPAGLPARDYSVPARQSNKRRGTHSRHRKREGTRVNTACGSSPAHSTVARNAQTEKKMLFIRESVPGVITADANDAKRLLQVWICAHVLSATSSSVQRDSPKSSLVSLLPRETKPENKTSHDFSGIVR